MQFRIDEEKAISAVLYIANILRQRNTQAGFHKIFKILYFAEQEHLAKWGRPITGDSYFAMEDGPVPSKTYDILKCLRGDKSCLRRSDYDNFFEVSDGYIVNPKREADTDDLAVSDIECLDNSIDANWNLTYGQLCDKSHGRAWQDTAPNRPIDMEKIAQEASGEGAIIEYIKVNAENSAFLG